MNGMYEQNQIEKNEKKWIEKLNELIESEL
jgi:hypothetical protein